MKVKVYLFTEIDMFVGCCTLSLGFYINVERPMYFFSGKWLAKVILNNVPLIKDKLQ